MDVGRIIAQVITANEPLLMKAVVSATETAVAQMCESYATQAEVNKLRSEVQVLKFDLDRQNQYSRRESIRISDISETGENTNALVTKLAADIGVSVTETDISVNNNNNNNFI